MAAKRKDHSTPLDIPASLQAAWEAVRGSAITPPQAAPTQEEIFLISTSPQYRDLPARLKAGTLFEGRGIYLCRWTPKDREGRKLKKTYHVFVAPEDLTDQAGRPIFYSYQSTITRLSSLKNWHGFDGRGIIDDKQLYHALKEDLYQGEWVVPPLEILTGHDTASQIFINTHNIYDDHNIDAFQGTYAAEWYWSCTKDGTDIYRMHIKSGTRYKASNGASACRPVRFEEVKKHDHKA